MQDLFTMSPLVVSAVPVVLALVAVVKSVGLSSRYAPIASILLGIGTTALTGLTWQATIAQGFLVGLMASGLWSGSKATFSSE